MDSPTSSKSSFVIHIVAKEERAVKIDPPIQADKSFYFGFIILISFIFGARLDISFLSLC